MVLFLLSKALYSGPADCDNKSSLMSNKCAVRMLQYWTFLTFQKIISTECPPSESHKRSQGGQFDWTTLQRQRENKEKYNDVSHHTNV